ncbi:sulfotransferase [Microbulbifer sp. SAOS-129_SWC]|uniref:tetratricopeptide repeat-containing sulfotransferase family protein n=1 Tax=Microbulbifer sp. SAOS-129_SWC TaxID=3145235 RepID=UPI0032175D81
MTEKHSAESYYQQARIALSQSQPQTARRLLQSGLSADSKHRNSWHLLADTHAAEGNLEQAIHTLEDAEQHFSGDADATLALQIHKASNLVKTGDPAAAASSITTDDFAAVKDWKLIARAGYLFAICEEHKKSLDAFNLALNSNDSDPDLLFNAAAANRSMGNLQSAEKLYEKVIGLSAHFYPVYTLRSGLRKQTEDNNHIAQLTALAQAADVSNEGKIHINYALAKELEDIKHYRESFSALKRGAELKKQSINYSVEPDLAAIDTIANTFTEHSTRKVSREEDQGQGIIFILGMPRTGSTLVDRILSAIDSVDSAGEPDTFAQLFYRAAFQASRNATGAPGNQIEAIKNSLRINFAELGRQYQEKLANRAKIKNAKTIIDKNPSNYLHIGAILLALPKAKIVHVQRDPMDSCYAIYKTLFKNAHPYSYDLNDLGRYYCAYRKLMNHWKDTFPEQIHEVSYEALTRNPEKEARELVDFCQLSWDDNCLNFYANKTKGTATASAAQVRQPIYTSSVGSWNHYTNELEPLRKIIQGK